MNRIKVFIDLQFILAVVLVVAGAVMTAALFLSELSYGGVAQEQQSQAAENELMRRFLLKSTYQLSKREWSDLMSKYYQQDHEIQDLPTQIKIDGVLDLHFDNDRLSRVHSWTPRFNGEQ